LSILDEIMTNTTHHL